MPRRKRAKTERLFPEIGHAGYELINVASIEPLSDRWEINFLLQNPLTQEIKSISLCPWAYYYDTEFARRGVLDGQVTRVLFSWDQGAGLASFYLCAASPERETSGYLKLSWPMDGEEMRPSIELSDLAEMPDHDSALAIHGISLMWKDQ